MNLKDKVAIVTGGARDIGRAVSVKLATEGAKVVVNYFSSQEDADQTLREIKAVGGEAILVKGDMTKQEDVDRLVAETVAAFGDHVDILVNVVGGLVARKTLQEMDADFFRLPVEIECNQHLHGDQGSCTTYGQWWFDHQFCIPGWPRWRRTRCLGVCMFEGCRNDFHPRHGQGTRTFKHPC